VREARVKVLLKIVYGFFRFWYDFVIGDCWPLALGVALILTAAVVAVRPGTVRPTVFAILVASALILLLVLTAAWEWWRQSLRRKP
jgi:hypothetical protein